eukprot:NODE_504_length_2168_cov_94.777253_g462_i0.p1 GENE.NODE_504_length_2168_cov_94.777253_g462_i0~~NODE_504_length_2168_cov_94.777253_g462_i0.p1  ORF type:complete len:508 (-),score=122.24 NODE_504_length_2168_cov_94.777253_g462_i0:133-1656(-)
MLSERELKEEAIQSLRNENEELDKRMEQIKGLTASLGIDLAASDFGRPHAERGPPPTGHVAIVFTDVQSSTELWEKHTVDMETSLDIHNQIMRDGIDAHNGYEVKTEGDAFMVTFRTSLDAVQWCLDMQQKLLNANWPTGICSHPSAEVGRGSQGLIWRGLRVRMGVHVGDPSAKRDPASGRMDYFGPMVNKSARVGGIGKGGQIVVSEDVLREIQQSGSIETLLNKPAIVDLGAKPLKGIAEPCHVLSILPNALSERRFSSEAAGDSAMAVSEDGAAGGGNRAKAANFYRFVNRLKDKVSNLPSDISGLEAAVRERDEEIKQMGARLASSEQSSRLLQQQAGALQAENDSLKMTADDLTNELNQARATEQLLQAAKTRAEAEAEAQRVSLLSRLAEAEKAAQDAAADRARLEAAAASARQEADALRMRMRDVDSILSSRLSLLTDVFSVYKKVDGWMRRQRGNQDATVIGGEFKAVVARHYSDDELAHLGSSRHLFPVLSSPASHK